jgi:hypothetical protein
MVDGEIREEENRLCYCCLVGFSSGGSSLPYNLRMILGSEVYNRWRLMSRNALP